MNVTIECIMCDAEHEFEIYEGVAPSRSYDGDEPSAECIDAGCDCSEICGNESAYWTQMEKRALAEAGDLLAIGSPFDTVEEWMGER